MPSNYEHQLVVTDGGACSCYDGEHDAGDVLWGGNHEPDADDLHRFSLVHDITVRYEQHPEVVSDE